MLAGLSLQFLPWRAITSSKLEPFSSFQNSRSLTAIITKIKVAKVERNKVPLTTLRSAHLNLRATTSTRERTMTANMMQARVSSESKITSQYPKTTQASSKPQLLSDQLQLVLMESAMSSNITMVASLTRQSSAEMISTTLLSLLGMAPKAAKTTGSLETLGLNGGEKMAISD